MAHRLAPEAAAELDDIWFYITERSSVETADRLIDRLTDAFLLLAGYPYAGRARDELGEGYRSFAVGNYVIFYRIRGGNVLILHVLHGAQDLEGKFEE